MLCASGLAFAYAEAGDAGLGDGGDAAVPLPFLVTTGGSIGSAVGGEDNPPLGRTDMGPFPN